MKTIIIILILTLTGCVTHNPNYNNNYSHKEEINKDIIEAFKTDTIQLYLLN
jgi:hypothetical protein